MSYNRFTESVLEIIKKIPKGRVMTYGLIAMLAGNPKAARQVSWILHSLTAKHKLPWWRVVNSKGMISIVTPEGKNEQLIMLRKEGVIVADNCSIDLEKYLWNGI